MTCPSIKQCFFFIYFLILNVYDTMSTCDELITCNINRFTNITLFDEMISNFWILITAWLQYTFDVIGFFLSAMPLWWILKGRKKWKERYAEFIRNYSAHLPVMIGDFSKEANRQHFSLKSLLSTLRSFAVIRERPIRWATTLLLIFLNFCFYLLNVVYLFVCWVCFGLFHECSAMLCA